MKKGVLIDAVNKTVTDVEVEDGIDAIYEKIQANNFDVVDIADNATLYVDGEALCKQAYIDEDGTKHGLHAFSFDGISQVMMGHGLILGFDAKTGESVDSPFNAENIEGYITFCEYDRPEDRPQPFMQFFSF